MLEFYKNAIEGAKTGRQRLNVLTCAANCRSINDTQHSILMIFARGVWYGRNS